MNSQSWLATNAKLLGVIAAAVIFGSWLIENIVAEKLKALRDTVVRAETDKEAAERFLRIESKLLEVYQVAASARGYAADARRSAKETYRDQLERDVELLERAGVIRDFAISLEGYSQKTADFLSAIDPPADIRGRVEKAFARMRNVRQEIEQRRARYAESQRNVIGSDSINPNTISEEQARTLGELIGTYRNDIEFEYGPRVAPAANELFRSYEALFAHAREQLARRERYVKAVRWIQLILFVIGSLTAIFASYLDSKAVTSDTPHVSEYRNELKESSLL